VAGCVGGQLHDRLGDALPVEPAAATGDGADAPGPVERESRAKEWHEHRSHTDDRGDDRYDDSSDR
jgi:hypothetical protein